jgi:hypothetical protein
MLLCHKSGSTRPVIGETKGRELSRVCTAVVAAPARQAACFVAHPHPPCLVCTPSCTPCSVPMSKVTAGNLVLLEGLEPLVTKTATVVGRYLEEEPYIFKPLRFQTRRCFWDAKAHPPTTHTHICPTLDQQRTWWFSSRSTIVMCSSRVS